MAKIINNSQLDVRVSFTINESECRALDALAGYGTESFIQAFYEKLGKAYMESHEAGLRQFLNDIRGVIGPTLRKVDKARKFLLEEENTK